MIVLHNRVLFFCRINLTDSLLSINFYSNIDIIDTFLFLHFCPAFCIIPCHYVSTVLTCIVFSICCSYSWNILLPCSNYLLSIIYKHHRDLLTYNIVPTLNNHKSKHMLLRFDTSYKWYLLNMYSLNYLLHIYMLVLIFLYCLE